jgi:nucleoside-diphosphate-sugar epimerase
MMHHLNFKGTLTLITRNAKSLTEIPNILKQHHFKIIELGEVSSHNFHHLNGNQTILVYAGTPTNSIKIAPIKFNSTSTEILDKVINKISKGKIILVHLSSGGLYQKNSRRLEKIPGNYPSISSSEELYLSEKLNIESWTNEFKNSENIIIRNPRIFSLYGPGFQLDKNFAICNFLKSARLNLPVNISGNPKSLRSYLYPTDFIQHLLPNFFINTPNYNQIGSKSARTIFSVGHQIAKFFNVEVVVQSNNREIDNYIPADILDIQEISFESGFLRWNNWLDRYDI